MFVQCQNVLLVLLVLIPTESSTADILFIYRNTQKLTEAVKNANKAIIEHHANCTYSYADDNHSKLINLHKNRTADKLIDKYLKTLEDWKIFSRIDEFMKLL